MPIRISKMIGMIINGWWLIRNAKQSGVRKLAADWLDSPPTSLRYQCCSIATTASSCRAVNFCSIVSCNLSCLSPLAQKTNRGERLWGIGDFTRLDYASASSNCCCISISLELIPRGRTELIAECPLTREFVDHDNRFYASFNFHMVNQHSTSLTS